METESKQSGEGGGTHPVTVNMPPLRGTVARKGNADCRERGASFFSLCVFEVFNKRIQQRGDAKGRHLSSTSALLDFFRVSIVSRIPLNSRPGARKA